MNGRKRFVETLHATSLQNSTSPLRALFPLWGALLTVAVIHSGSLGNRLVADSFVFVAPHTFIGTCAYFFTSIIPPEWESLWLRPIPMFLFWLDSKLWPGTVWGPHLTNIILHVVNTWLIWEIVRFMQSGVRTHEQAPPGGLPAFIAALVYGLHPLTVGAVAWIAARFDVMSITFGLAGLFMWLKYDTGIHGKRGPVGATVLLLLSILSKEQGVVFLAVCLLISSQRFFTGKNDRRKALKSMVLPVLLPGLYIIYRLFIFSGMGGYLTARHGLNFLIPFYYLFASLFPFMNSMPGWTVSWTLSVAVILLGATVAFMWKSPDVETLHAASLRMNTMYTVAALALFIIGLATTAPHAGMTLEQIMGHAESRFALIPITGLALLAGIAAHVFVRMTFQRRAVLAFLFIIGTAALWRTDVQIQSWRNAGLTAESIIRQTLEIAPSPPQGSHLIFLDVPRNNDQYAYIFGIGLKEALIQRYGGRQDMEIIRYPKREDLGTAIPERDFVFQYHTDTGMLEKLKAVRKKRTE